jgi:hypothetical protein
MPSVYPSGEALTPVVRFAPTSARNNGHPFDRAVDAVASDRDEAADATGNCANNDKLGDSTLAAVVANYS